MVRHQDLRADLDVVPQADQEADHIHDLIDEKEVLAIRARHDLAHFSVDEARADDPGLDPVVVVGVLDDLGQGAEGVLADTVGCQARDDGDPGLAADVDHAAEAAFLHAGQDSRTQNRQPSAR